MLLSKPATVPNAQRNNPAYEPAAPTHLTYTGQAAVGPGPPIQIVIAAYHTIGQPKVGGQLTIHLASGRTGWRVAGLG